MCPVCLARDAMGDRDGREPMFPTATSGQFTKYGLIGTLTQLGEMLQIPELDTEAKQQWGGHSIRR
eukprot:5381804-Amphidinium_carterae.1